MRENAVMKREKNTNLMLSNDKEDMILLFSIIAWFYLSSFYCTG